MSTNLDTILKTYYFLRCHFYNSSRATLMNNFGNIKSSFAAVSDNNLISLLLYGNDKLDGRRNRRIFRMSTIRFIEDSRRFDEQLFYNLPASYPYAAIFICCFAEGFILLFQRASFTRYFTLGFFFIISYNFTFYISAIQMKNISCFVFCFCFKKLFRKKRNKVHIFFYI